MPITPQVIIYLSIAFATLGAQWTGVVALAHRGKNGAWMTLFAGAALSTAAKVGTTGFAFADPRILPQWRALWFGILPMVENVGGLIFFIGFAMHALGFMNGRAWDSER